jgi:hypothetical protein
MVQWRPADPVSGFAYWIATWLATIPLDRWAAWADGEADMVAILRRQVPGGLAVARPVVQAALGPAALAAARRFGPPEWAALIAQVEATLPDHGLIIALHEPWFRGQLARVRDVLCGGAGP